MHKPQEVLFMDPFTLGIFSGVVAALIGLLILRKFTKDSHSREYDERQQLLQGKANKAGFWTLITLCALYALVSEAGLEFCSVGMAMFFVICISIITYAVIAIHYDAYIGFRANTRKQYVAFGVLFAVMVLDSVMMVRHNGLFEDGMMSVAWLPMCATLMYIILFSAMFIHNRKTKRAEQEEE